MRRHNIWRDKRVTLNDTIKSLPLGGGDVHVVIDLVSCLGFFKTRSI